MNEDVVSLAEAAAAVLAGVTLSRVLHGSGDLVLPATFLVSAVDLVVLAVPVYVTVVVFLGEDGSVAAPGVSWLAVAVAALSGAALWTLQLLLAAGPRTAGAAGLVLLWAGYSGTALVGIRMTRRRGTADGT